MFLRDLMFWRKPDGVQGKGQEATPVAAGQGALHPTSSQTKAIAGSGHGLTVLRLDPFRAEPDATEAEILPLKPISRRESIVQRRVSPLTLAATASAAERQAAILDRLGIVHDPSEVIVAGTGQTLRIVMVNGRLMSARFSFAARSDAVFSFQKRGDAKRAAKGFAAGLAGLCATPVDLIMTERAISGVFDAAVGMDVEDLAGTPAVRPAARQPKAVETADA